MSASHPPWNQYAKTWLFFEDLPYHPGAMAADRFFEERQKEKTRQMRDEYLYEKYCAEELAKEQQQGNYVGMFENMFGAIND